jgi:pimeloyl-ACP methyl ester carboxylesterase
MAYEEVGRGRTLVCLHSGWGEKAMPFDDAREVLASRYRLVFPDRFGYGRSDPLEWLDVDYHARAAEDLVELLDRLGVGAAILWGHSDGAVSAALVAADHPERVGALVLEAAHFHRAKSLEFFETYARDPERLPEHVKERLVGDHGARWRDVVRLHSEVWIAFHEIGRDFYEGRLERIACPALVLHGAKDPHTPVVEVEEIARRIRGADLQVLPDGGHSPHSEPATARTCSLRVAEFLERYAF